MSGGADSVSAAVSAARKLLKVNSNLVGGGGFNGAVDELQHCADAVTDIAMRDSVVQYIDTMRRTRQLNSVPSWRPYVICILRALGTLHVDARVKPETLAKAEAENARRMVAKQSPSDDAPRKRARIKPAAKEEKVKVEPEECIKVEQDISKIRSSTIKRPVKEETKEAKVKVEPEECIKVEADEQDISKNRSSTIKRPVKEETNEPELFIVKEETNEPKLFIVNAEQSKDSAEIDSLSRNAPDKAEAGETLAGTPITSGGAAQVGQLWAIDSEGTWEVVVANEGKGGIVIVQGINIKEGIRVWCHVVHGDAQSLVLGARFAVVAAGQELHILYSKSGILVIPPVQLSSVPIHIELSDPSGKLLLLLGDATLLVLDITNRRCLAETSLRGICELCDIEKVTLDPAFEAPILQRLDGKPLLFRNDLQQWVEMAPLS